jgi:hypothetical protein
MGGDIRVHIKFWSEILKRRESLGDIDVDGRIILKGVIHK